MTRNDSWLERCDIAIRHRYDFLSVSCSSFPFSLLKSGSAAFNSIHFFSLVTVVLFLFFLPLLLTYSLESDKSRGFVSNRSRINSSHFETELVKISAPETERADLDDPWIRETGGGGRGSVENLHLICQLKGKMLRWSKRLNMNVVEETASCTLIAKLIQLHISID